MESSAEKQGLRHKARHKKRQVREANLGEQPYWSDAQWKTAVNGRPVLFLPEKWGIPQEEIRNDRRVAHIFERLQRIWPRLKPEHRILYLQTAEKIADAERAMQAWNPKTSRKQHVRFLKVANSAAKLVQKIETIFPSPWLGIDSRIGELVFELASFSVGTVFATLPTDIRVAIDSASDHLQVATKTIGKRLGGMKWELFGELVWLASGKCEIEERTLRRRYIDKQSDPKAPARGSYDWELIGHVSRLARKWRAQNEPPENSLQNELYKSVVPLLTGIPGDLGELELDDFEKAARRYLKGF